MKSMTLEELNAYIDKPRAQGTEVWCVPELEEEQDETSD